jgi:sulfonate transport system ATP-binding protein
MAGVNISQLTKRYTIEERTFAALDGVDLSIADGSFTTIVGRSGSGKTTLLRLLSGLEEATSGGIEFTYRDGTQVPKARHIGIVFQEPRLMPWLTVAENIAFSRLGNPDRDGTQAMVDRYLEMLGLEKFRNAYPAQISGGMAQRVALGRTLCYDPDLILMDEPISALDYFTRKKLQNELIDLFLSEGKTFLLVTHDVEEALYLGQKVIVLGGGRLIREFPVELPYRRKRTSPAFLSLQEAIVDLIQEADQAMAEAGGS